MTRFLALILGLFAAGLAIWILASDRSEPPLDHIDDASRAKLERVLREAESESGGSP